MAQQFTPLNQIYSQFKSILSHVGINRRNAAVGGLDDIGTQIAQTA
jgi:hypothetical protein